MRVAFLSALLWLSWSAPALAAQILLNAESQSLREGQISQIYLTVVDGTVAGPPKLPDVPGISTSYEGQQQRAQVINARTTRSTTFSYRLTALAPGEVTIPPVALKVDGRVARSNSLTLQIEPRSDEGAGEGLVATIGADRIWVGQTIVYHAAFRTRQRLEERTWVLPEYEGFVAEQTVESEEQAYTLDEGGGRATVLELDVPLVATAEGDRDLDPVVLRARFRVERSRRQGRRSVFDMGVDFADQAYASRPIDAPVWPLPEEGRGGWSGLVGDFEIRAELSAPEIALGESATLTLTVSGDGTLSGFSPPTLDGGDAFQAYADTPEITSALRGGRFQTRGVYRWAIVPEAEGEIALPPIQLRVFSPSEGDWHDLEAAVAPLQVGGGEVGGGVQSFTGSEPRQEIAELGDDILPNHPRARLRSQLLRPALPALGAVVGLPALALIGLFGRDLLARRGGRREDPRRALAAKLRGLEGAPLGEVEAALREALGLALGRPAAGVDRAAIEAGLEGALRDRALALYRDVEAARYGGGDPAGLAKRVIACAQPLLEVKP